MISKKDKSDFLGNYYLNKMLDLQNINIDGRLTRKEIAEVRKIKEYSKEKLDLLFNMQTKFREFINLEYRYANENYLNSKKKTIKDLQKKINEKLGLQLSEDNIFGKQTFLAIIKFQKENNLVIDGLVGKKIFKKLFQDQKQILDKPSKQQKGKGSIPELILAETKKQPKQIILKAIQAVENGDRLGASNCTDWVSKIWGKDVNTGSYIFKGKIERSRLNIGTGLIPKIYASNNIISQIKPGDHILVDKPPYKRGRTHSLIALEKPNNYGLIKVASYSWGRVKSKIEYRDLNGSGRGDKEAHVARIHRFT